MEFSSWRRQQPGGSCVERAPAALRAATWPLSTSGGQMWTHTRQPQRRGHRSWVTLDRQEGEKVAADTGDTHSVSQASALLFHPKFSPPVTLQRPAGAAVTPSPTGSSTAVAISPHILICE